MKSYVCTLTYILFYSINLFAEQDESVKPISSYIEENYDILFISPKIKNAKDVDYYLLAEQHNLIGHKHVNSMLINQYAQENDIVLVEGVPSLQEIQPDESLQSMWISAPVIVKGWDSGWMKDITGIDLTHIEKLGIKLLLVQHDMVWNKSHEKKKEYRKLISQLRPLMQEIQPMFDINFEKIIKDTFPARVASMESSLGVMSVANLCVKAVQVVSDRPIRDTKIFLIAGLYHLWQDTSNPYFDDPKMSLECLYDFLSKHKAVILIPKQPVTEYWNSFYDIPL